MPDPGPGEALVRVNACGVCHTDLHYREGGLARPVLAEDRSRLMWFHAGLGIAG